MSATAIALNRFGLGARPLDRAFDDPQQALLRQFELYDPLPAPWRALQRTPELLKAYLSDQLSMRDESNSEKKRLTRAAYRRFMREQYIAACGARANSALKTHAPFVERLVHFWANHFAVSVEKMHVEGLAGGFEADAIRPHVLGRFEDLLLAAVRHPALMIYLDQVKSIGPQSPAAKEGRPRQGLNENLAREILELHTLGVRGGYTQTDVIEVAKALTGWSLPTQQEGLVALGKNSTFHFNPSSHQPGFRTVLGRTYAQMGEEQAHSILRDLAAAHSTAQHVACKLVRHFVGEDPSAALVRRLTDTFLQTNGDLSSVYRALLAAPEAWRPGFPKFKTPWEWLVSSLRALGLEGVPSATVVNLLRQLGQPLWRPGSPAGYDDLTATWAVPSTLVHRLQVAHRLVSHMGSRVDARALGEQLLPGVLSGATEIQISNAESWDTALVLLLVSPEFLRR